MKWLVASIVLLACGAFSWKMLVATRKIVTLTRNSQVTIEVDGKRVQGDMLAGRYTAILTTRDAEKVHSYQFLYAGDVDRGGDIGLVLDCGSWVAPRLPFLIASDRYPPCSRYHRKQGSRSLLQRNGGMQFVTDSGSTVKLTPH